MQAGNNETATGLDATGPMATIQYHTQIYGTLLSKSRQNLREPIGLLLWRLQCPMRQEQRKTGYRLLEVLLLARYERGAL